MTALFNDLLSPTLQRLAIPAFGVVATLMGATGLIRKETGALSPAERSTVIGRILTPILSGLWLFTGVLFLISQFLEEPMQTDVVGYTSIVATIIFLIVLVGALAGSIFTRGQPEPTPAARRAAQAARAARPAGRYQRFDAVIHPDFGSGRVLATYFESGDETVAVRFSEGAYSVPADTLYADLDPAEFIEAPSSQPAQSPSILSFDPTDAQIAELENLLTGLESQRDTLGNQALETSMKPLQDKLVALIFARNSPPPPPPKNRDAEIEELENLLTGLESQRETLGNQALEITMKPLRDKLVSLVFEREEAMMTIPQFSHQIAFGTTPSEAFRQPTFPAGVARVYASFRYDHMREGLHITREWYRNGEVFFRRTKPWDFARYGTSGTIHDIFVHDQNGELQPGTYELRLYIDGVPQFDQDSGWEHRAFAIDTGW